MTRDELAKISVRRVACLAGGLSGVLNAKITTETAVMRLVKSKYTTYMTCEFMKENTLRKAAKSTNAEHNPLPSLKHSSSCKRFITYFKPGLSSIKVNQPCCTFTLKLKPK